MRRFTVILSIFLILLMASSVYASDIFETGVWRETGVLNNGIRYGVVVHDGSRKGGFSA